MSTHDKLRAIAAEIARVRLLLTLGESSAFRSFFMNGEPRNAACASEGAQAEIDRTYRQVFPRSVPDLQDRVQD